MTISGIVVDGTDLGTFAWELKPDAPGLDDAANASIPTAQAPDTDGETEMTTRPTRAAREIVLAGLMRATSDSALQANIDKLKYWLTRGDANGLIALRASHVSTREYIGRASVLAVVWKGSPYFGGVGRITADATITVRCAKPFARATSDRTEAFTSNTAMPLGTARVRPFLRATAGGGGCGAITVTLKNSSGTTIATLVYDQTSFALAAGEKLEIDCETGLQEKVASGGGRTNAAKYRNDVSTFPLVLDPKKDGNYLTSAWPTLSGSVASGSATFEAVYRERWE